MPKHVLVALPLSDAQRSALQASVPEYEFIFAQTETVTLAQVLEADIIMGNVPVELICQNHHLEWFQSNFAGPDTYLVPGVLPEQCLVTNATGAYGLAISEWMLGLWLGLQKDLFLYRDRQTQHKWDAITRQVRPVAGSRVLCVGMGDIGSNFAMRAHALGAEVVGVRRSVRPGAPCPDYCLRVVPQSELDAELPQADLVALSLPGTPETLHMFDATRLARCKQGAILLNVGRGSTVDCLALADAVHSGHLFGAALDVTDPEPLPSDHPLWSEPNVIITPHISGRFSLAKTLDNIVEIFIHNLKLYAAGQPVDNQVSRTTHYVSGGSGGQRLVCGAPGEYAGSVEAHFLPDDTAETDAAWIAQHIEELVQNGTPVRDGSSTRPVQYEDCCILLAARGDFLAYEEALTARGIPVYADARENLMTAPHIRPLISLLKVIDNPAQDIYLAAAMLGPRYGFTDDALVRLRACSEETQKKQRSPAQSTPA